MGIVLSVIVPDNRPGMQRMLEQEFMGVENEVIYASWKTGLKKAKGDFVLLLERDSAISRGSIARQLSPFLDNPLFRKLAMVSPLVEFDDCNDCIDLANPTKVYTSYAEPCLTRVGSLAGSIIRRSSLMKHSDNMKSNMAESSHNLSVDFWDDGLRIMLDPHSVYYSPSRSRFTSSKTKQASAELMSLWKRECLLT